MPLSTLKAGGIDMAWYYGEFACGHEGRVNIIGPGKDRRWKADREFGKLCEECWREERERLRKLEVEEAEKKAKRMELPELTGSEKQVAWANVLRQKLIDRFTDIAGDEFYIRHGIRCYDELKDITKEDILLIRDYIIENITEARYYIDRRSDKVEAYIRREMNNALKSDEDKYYEKLLEEERLNSIIYPDDKKTDAVVEIDYTSKEINLKFVKDEEFKETVKDIGYRWDNGVWNRELSIATGDYKDRVAEAGNKLLNRGFPVMIVDEDIRKMAINGEYEEECTRWVFATEGNEFSISWSGRNDSLYRVARSLPGSRWRSSVIVNVEHYKEVEEFAELYGFKFSEGAKKLIEVYKKRVESLKTVVPAKVDECEDTSGLEKILESSSDILEDLKDD